MDETTQGRAVSTDGALLANTRLTRAERLGCPYCGHQVRLATVRRLNGREDLMIATCAADGIMFRGDWHQLKTMQLEVGRE